MFGWTIRKERQTPAVEVKASAAGRVAALSGAGRVVWSPRDVVSLTKAGFTGNPVGFRAVRLIAEAAAAIPVNVQDATRRYAVHPVQDLLTRPNAEQGRAELMETLFGQLLFSGPIFNLNFHVQCLAWKIDSPMILSSSWPQKKTTVGCLFFDEQQLIVYQHAGRNLLT